MRRPPYLDELPALTADLPRDPEPQRRPRTRLPGRVPSEVLMLFIAMLLAWVSMVAAAIYGAFPPLFALFPFPVPDFLRSQARLGNARPLV